MQKSSLQTPDDDSKVCDSWEELADDLEITAPEPVPPPKVERKKTKAKLEKPPKPLPSAEPSSSTTSTVPTAKSTALSPSPEIGKVRILKRDPSAQKPQPLKPTAPTPPTKSYEERVAAYNEARMRIFGCTDDESQRS